MVAGPRPHGPPGEDGRRGTGLRQSGRVWSGCGVGVGGVGLWGGHRRVARSVLWRRIQRWVHDLDVLEQLHNRNARCKERSSKVLKHLGLKMYKCPHCCRPVSQEKCWPCRIGAKRLLNSRMWVHCWTYAKSSFWLHSCNMEAQCLRSAASCAGRGHPAVHSSKAKPYTTPKNV